MDDIVSSEYTSLYRDFPDRYEVRSSIDRAHEELRKETGRVLRADASYLLLINFAAMIIAPAERAGKVSVGEMRDSTASDIRIIVREAARISREEEISGHQVIAAVNNVWGRLKTMTYNIWD